MRREESKGEIRIDGKKRKESRRERSRDIDAPVKSALPIKLGEEKRESEREISGFKRRRSEIREFEGKVKRLKKKEPRKGGRRGEEREEEEE